MHFKKSLLGSALAVSLVGTALGLSAPATSASSAPAHAGPNASSAVVKALGGETNYKALEALYHQVMSSGHTSMVIYGAGVAAEVPVFAGFSNYFPGTSITQVQLIGPNILAKISAENASGDRIASAIETGPSLMVEEADNGEFVSYKPITPTPIPSTYRGPNEAIYSPGFALFGITYNTNLVSKKQLPATYKDLLESKWNNQITMEDPTVAGGTEDTFAHLALTGHYGLSYLQSLKKQNIEIFPSSNSTGAVTAVAQGQRELAIASNASATYVASSAGAPVAFFAPTPTPYTQTWFGVINKSPAALLAELYEAFSFTPAGAKLRAQYLFQYSPLYTTITPPGQVSAKKLKNLTPPTPVGIVVKADENAEAESLSIWG
jgi:iron(III) transport system substrate-binding protein